MDIAQQVFAMKIYSILVSPKENFVFLAKHLKTSVLSTRLRTTNLFSLTQGD